MLVRPSVRSAACIGPPMIQRYTVLEKVALVGLLIVRQRRTTAQEVTHTHPHSTRSDVEGQKLLSYQLWLAGKHFVCACTEANSKGTLWLISMLYFSQDSRLNHVLRSFSSQAGS